MTPSTTVRDRVERLCRSATDPLALYREVVPVLDRAVPADLWCGLLFDPATVMNTGGYHDEGLPLEVLPRLLELEVGAEDVNQFPELVRDRTGVATLHRRTGGRPELSARYRDVMVPAGMGPELRAILRDRGRPWGGLAFFREKGAPDFSEAEIELVAALAPEIAAAVRRTLLMTEMAHRDAEEGPGMAVLRVEGLTIEVELASRAARVLMDQMPDTRIDGVPAAVVVLVSRLIAADGRRQSARVRLRTGRWMSVQLDVLEPADTEGPERLSLVIEPLAPYELAGVIAEAYGLTAREREVARLVVAGNSNPEVAAALSISVTTVQDHLKKVFAKLGVGSRHELTARMFFDQYLPRQMARTPVGGDGWYIPRDVRAGGRGQVLPRGSGSSLTVDDEGGPRMIREPDHHRAGR